MARNVRQRFWIETTLAIATGILFIVTLFWHDWIEIVFRVDPDHGSGWFEWVIVGTAFALAATFSISALREWRLSLPRAALRDGTT